MDKTAIIRHLTETFPDLQQETSGGNHFFFTGDNHRFPFATLVTDDSYDTVSNLNRPGVFRLNLGISKTTFLALFESRPSRPGASGVSETGHDLTALDQLMPHPVYGSMYWVCILNPSDATFQESITPLLAEAYEIANKHAI